MTTPHDSGSITDRIANGEFAMSIQLDPPSGAASCDDLFRFAADLAARGWTIFDINSTRRPLAVSALAIASRLRGAGCVAIPHLTAREALARGILSDIRSAYELFDVRDVLVIRGDPAEDDQHIEHDLLRVSGGVFELEAPALVGRIARDVRVKCNAFGIRIGVAYTLPPPPDTCVTLGTKESGEELLRLRAKFEAGADFVMTQPVFRAADWFRVREQIDRDPMLRDQSFLVGIWPIFDERTLGLLGERGCSGVFLPQPVRDALRRYPVADWGRASMEACAALLTELRRSGTVAGVYVITPFRRGAWAAFTEYLPALRIA